jgi:hypothetical protein
VVATVVGPASGEIESAACVGADCPAIIAFRSTLDAKDPVVLVRDCVGWGAAAVVVVAAEVGCAGGPLFFLLIHTT